MSKGYVYILTNESMPGLVKVGKTTRDPEARADELYQTGVPTRFKVHHYALSPDCGELEMQMHEALDSDRVSISREFFRADPDHAQSCLDGLLHAQVGAWAEEFVVGYRFVHELCCVDELTIHRISGDLGVPTHEVASAMEWLTPEEVGPGLDRYRIKRDEAKALREALKKEGQGE